MTRSTETLRKRSLRQSTSQTQAREKLKAKGVRQKTTEEKALTNESEDVSKTRIKQLSVELTEETQQPKGRCSPIVPPPKGEEPPRREEHDRKFLDDLSRKDKQVD